MPELVITRGLPGSGKTTWAQAWVRERPGERWRCNRDDARAALYNVYIGLTYEQEQQVTRIQRAAAEGMLRAGISVVVDDTNLVLKHARAWADLAAKLGAEFRVQDFTDVDVAICVLRDGDRYAAGGRGVGAPVIYKMAERFGLPRELPPVVASQAVAPSWTSYDGTDGQLDAWLVDVDGTLARMVDRRPFEWHRVGEDEVVEVVRAVVHGLAATGYKVVIMSGRDEVCRAETEMWLVQHEVPYDDLVMRPQGDNRKDSIVKHELFWKYVAPVWNVVGVLDDRNQVVEMWRAIGLPCLQVAPGDF